MLQYKNGSTINGPTKASLSSSLIVYQKQFYHKTSYEGKSVIVEKSDFNIDTIKILTSKKADSIIVKISTEPLQSLSSSTNNNKNNIDKLILNEKEYEIIYTSSLKFKIEVPIYFVKKEEYNELIKNTYEISHHQISNDIITPKQQNDFKFLISLGLPEIINNPNSYNFQTTLKCKQLLSSTPPPLPPKKIVILASYDTYSIIPALSGEINNHGNTLAIFELLRVFSKLYSNPNTQPTSLDLVFTLVGASSLNEYGVRRWIDQQSQSFLNSIDHVLCIDSIGMKSFSTLKNNYNDIDDYNNQNNKEEEEEEELINDENKLYLQVSRPSTKSNKIKNLYEKYQFSANNYNINLTVIQKKIDLSIPKINFKHEIFSRKHIHSMTITQKQFSSPTTNGILSTHSKFSLPILKRNTKIIASSLLSQIYNNNINNLTNLLQFSLDINEQSMLSMNQVLLNTNLMFPYIQPLKPIIINSTDNNNNNNNNNNRKKKQTIVNNQNNNNKIDLINGIELIFKEYNDKIDYVIDVFQTGILEIGNTIEFYQPTKATMSFVQIKPISFDVLMILFSITYLFFFYCWIIEEY
ncbi:hypothetical protein ACTFIV_000313 [Dictyostelium citrinum]